LPEIGPKKVHFLRVRTSVALVDLPWLTCFGLVDLPWLTCLDLTCLG
jgi:hypothetical protein